MSRIKDLKAILQHGTVRDFIQVTAQAINRDIPPFVKLELKDRPQEKSDVLDLNLVNSAEAGLHSGVEFTFDDPAASSIKTVKIFLDGKEIDKTNV